MWWWPSRSCVSIKVVRHWPTSVASKSALHKSQRFALQTEHARRYYYASAPGNNVNASSVCACGNALATTLTNSRNRKFVQVKLRLQLCRDRTSQDLLWCLVGTSIVDARSVTAPSDPELSLCNESCRSRKSTCLERTGRYR